MSSVLSFFFQEKAIF